MTFLRVVDVDALLGTHISDDIDLYFTIKIVNDTTIRSVNRLKCRPVLTITDIGCAAF